MKNNFSADFTVRIGEINYGGHMGNDKSLMIFHDARISFLNHLGHSELDIGDNTGIIISEAFVKFKKEVFLNDNLRVFISISDIKEVSFSMNYSILRIKDEKEVLTGYTKVVTFDYQNKKVVQIPKEFLAKILPYKID